MKKVIVEDCYVNNGLGISDVADFKYHSRYEEPQLSKVKMFNRSTSAAI